MPKAGKITPEISHHGHRDRLRGRFIRSGTGAFEDYELLELALFSAIPRKDVKPLAKQLLVRFGSMGGILGATIDDLQTVKGISENTAVFIKAMHALSLRMLMEEIKEKPILTSWQKLIDYCRIAMAHEKREHFRVLFLNKKTS